MFSHLLMLCRPAGLPTFGFPITVMAVVADLHRAFPAFGYNEDISVGRIVI